MIYPKILIVFLLAVVFAGCAVHTAHDEAYVAEAIKQRTDVSIRTVSETDDIVFPPGTDINDSLDMEEAIAIALWNNRQFQSDLATLGFMRADLVEAGLFQNPQLSLLFPVGPKQLEAALSLPLQSLWQRPKRVVMAKLNHERVAENLIRNALTLVRDVKLAFVDFYKAQKQYELMDDAMKYADDIMTITASRLASGDISDIEAASLEMSALQVGQAALEAEKALHLNAIRLKQLLGMISETGSFEIAAPMLQDVIVGDEASLVSEALRSRPDVRAAELEIEAAGKQLEWEASKTFNLIAILDANGEGKEGFEIGPGMQLELPIFNQNDGGKARAEARMQYAAKKYAAVTDDVRREIVEAYQGYIASKKHYELMKNGMVLAAEHNAKKQYKAYSAGAISYLAFLEFEKQRNGIGLQFAEAEASLLRSIAQLEYSVGNRLPAGEQTSADDAAETPARRPSNYSNSLR